MKVKYLTILWVLIVSAIVFSALLLTSSQKLHPNLPYLLQGLGIFVALFASIIALSAADPKTKKTKVYVETEVDWDSKSTYQTEKLSPDLADIYSSFTLPIVSCKVYFNIRNESGFTLKRPTLTFRLPINKQHPEEHPVNYSQRTFHSNMFNYQRDMVSLETADKIILSNSNLPFWNDRDELNIWIRMAFERNDETAPFSIEFSVNSDNAEGITLSVEINPRLNK